MGTSCRGADIAAQVLSVDRQSAAATAWVNELQAAGVVVQAGHEGAEGTWFLRRRHLLPSMVGLPERPEGWTRREGQWEHWWAPHGCAGVPEWMMGQAAPDIEACGKVRALHRAERGRWRVSVDGEAAHAKVGSTVYDAVIIATDPASAAALVEGSADVEVEPGALQDVKGVVGRRRLVVAVCVPGAAAEALFGADRAEWRDPDNADLHLGAWQDAKRGAASGQHRSADDGGVSGLARLVFQSTHASAARGEEAVVWAVAAALDLPLMSLRDVETFTLGVEAATASAAVVSDPMWRANKCWALGDRLVVCGDYFGAAPTFTSCVVSAQAAVQHIAPPL